MDFEQTLIRRRFLSFLSTGFFLSSSGCISVLSSDDPFNFVKRRFKPPKFSSIEEALQQSVPIGEPRELSDRFEEHFFAVPDSKKYSERTVDYCKRAAEFLKKELPISLLPEWVVLKHGDDYTNNFSEKAFIGQCYFYALRDFDDPKLSFLDQIDLFNGGVARMKFNHLTKDYESYYIFIPTSSAAIQAVFSEIIHLTTTIRIAEERNRSSRIAEEIFAEGAAYHLNRKISREMNIPLENERILELDRTYENNPSYLYVPASIKLIGKKGLRQTYDLFMENPRKFMEEILLYT